MIPRAGEPPIISLISSYWDPLKKGNLPILTPNLKLSFSIERDWEVPSRWVQEEGSWWRGPGLGALGDGPYQLHLCQ